MRIVAFELGPRREGARTSWGILGDRGIIDLGQRAEVEAPTILAALRTTTLLDLAMHAAGCPPDHQLVDVRLLAPLPRPRRRGYVLETSASRPAARSSTSQLCLVIGTATEGLQLGRDPLEFVAGCTLIDHFAMGPFVLTRDEWTRRCPGFPEADFVADRMARMVARAGSLLVERLHLAVRSGPLSPGDVLACPDPEGGAALWPRQDLLADRSTDSTMSGGAS